MALLGIAAILFFIYDGFISEPLPLSFCAALQPSVLASIQSAPAPILFGCHVTLKSDVRPSRYAAHSRGVVNPSINCRIDSEQLFFPRSNQRETRRSSDADFYDVW
jgi:hypothetical protein